MTRPATVDAHHHLWQLDGALDYGWLDAPALATIRRDYDPEDLAPLLRAEGIDQSVYVQTLADRAETRRALDLADRHPFMVGVVGWVDLQADDCRDQLDEFRAHPKFVGVRHVVHDEPDPDWVVRPAVLRGLKVLEAAGVPFDLLFRPEHLRHVPTLARACPDLPMVIDHLAKPPIRAGRDDGWAANLEVAASFPNVWCKLSGMVTEADHRAWNAGDLQPYADVALDLFGPDRLMFGSDWPVCELAATYDRVHQAARALMGGLSDAEAGAVFGGTATRFYRLGVASGASPAAG